MRTRRRLVEIFAMLVLYNITHADDAPRVVDIDVQVPKATAGPSISCVDSLYQSVQRIPFDCLNYLERAELQHIHYRAPGSENARYPVSQVGESAIINGINEELESMASGDNAISIRKTRTGYETGPDGGAENGTPHGAEEGTDTGTENGTLYGAEEGTETGAENGTLYGAEEATETGTESATKKRAYYQPIFVPSNVMKWPQVDWATNIDDELQCLQRSIDELKNLEEETNFAMDKDLLQTMADNQPDPFGKFSPRLRHKRILRVRRKGSSQPPNQRRRDARWQQGVVEKQPKNVKAFWKVQNKPQVFISQRTTMRITTKATTHSPVSKRSAQQDRVPILPHRRNLRRNKKVMISPIGRKPYFAKNTFTGARRPINRGQMFLVSANFPMKSVESTTPWEVPRDPWALEVNNDPWAVERELGFAHPKWKLRHVRPKVYQRARLRKGSAVVLPRYRLREIRRSQDRDDRNGISTVDWTSYRGQIPLGKFGTLRVTTEETPLVGIFPAQNSDTATNEQSKERGEFETSTSENLSVVRSWTSSAGNWKMRNRRVLVPMHKTPEQIKKVVRPPPPKKNMKQQKRKWQKQQKRQRKWSPRGKTLRRKSVGKLSRDIDTNEIDDFNLDGLDEDDDESTLPPLRRPVTAHGLLRKRIELSSQSSPDIESMSQKAAEFEAGQRFATGTEAERRGASIFESEQRGAAEREPTASSPNYGQTKQTSNRVIEIVKLNEDTYGAESAPPNSAYPRRGAQGAEFPLVTSSLQNAPLVPAKGSYPITRVQEAGILDAVGSSVARFLSSIMHVLRGEDAKLVDQQTDKHTDEHTDGETGKQTDKNKATERYSSPTFVEATSDPHVSINEERLMPKDEYKQNLVDADSEPHLASFTQEGVRFQLRRSPYKPQTFQKPFNYPQFGYRTRKAANPLTLEELVPMVANDESNDDFGDVIVNETTSDTSVAEIATLTALMFNTSTAEVTATTTATALTLLEKRKQLDPTRKISQNRTSVAYQERLEGILKRSRDIARRLLHKLSSDVEQEPLLVLLVRQVLETVTAPVFKLRSTVDNIVHGADEDDVVDMTVLEETKSRLDRKDPVRKLLRTLERVNNGIGVKELTARLREVTTLLNSRRAVANGRAIHE